MFISKIADAAGEAGETEVWLDFAKDSKYLEEEDYKNLFSGYTELSKILAGIIDKPEKFCKIK